MSSFRIIKLFVGTEDNYKSTIIRLEDMVAIWWFENLRNSPLHQNLKIVKMVQVL